MRRFLDVRFLWLVGAIMLVFCTVGLVAAATAVGLPLLLGAAALGIPQEKAVEILAYASPVWAPVGVGMGMVATGSIVKGIGRKDPAARER